MQPRVGRGDDRADGLLVEALVALAALEVFEVAADRPLAEELVVLVGVDPAELERAVGAVPGDRPALAGGERLAQEREVRERRHRLDAGLGLEAVAQAVEVELGFEVVHAGLEDRLAVQGDPEPDGPRPRQVGQGLVGEVLGGLLGGEVEVGEDDDAGDRVLEDLGTPAGVGAGVEPLAELEARAA